MKVAVYTIAKNEAKYAARWARSAKDADYLVVLDTGSTDNTVEILQNAGVEVHRASIEPWRFDEARNQALALVPQDADVCISLDMDEVLRDGWRAGLEAAWTPATTILRHPLYPEWEEDHSKPKRYFAYVARAHARNAYRWHYAVHEILAPVEPDTHHETFAENFVIDHLTDHAKVKPLYTNMLEAWVAREPNEPRYAFYLAVDLYNRQKYAESFALCVKYLHLESPEAKSQRSFTKRLMANASRALGAPVSEVIPLLYSATVEAQDEREPWVALADACAAVGNWPNALAAATNALRCKDQTKSFHIDFDSWQGKPERLLEESAKALEIPHEVLMRLKQQIDA